MERIEAPWAVLGYIIPDTRKPKGMKRSNKLVRTRNHKLSIKMFQPSGTIFYKQATARTNDE